MAIFNRPYDGGMPQGSEGSADTVIAQGVRVEGEFVSEGNVIIEGEVHGSISTSSHLMVGTNAKIVADVKATTALVAGAVEGNMKIAGRLELKSSSRVVGDVTAEDLIIESGAVLNGRISMGQPAEALAVNGVAAKRKNTRREEMLAESPAEV